MCFLSLLDHFCESAVLRFFIVLLCRYKRCNSPPPLHNYVTDSSLWTLISCSYAVHHLLWQLTFQTCLYYFSSVPSHISFTCCEFSRTEEMKKPSLLSLSSLFTSPALSSHLFVTFFPSILVSILSCSSFPLGDDVSFIFQRCPPSCTCSFSLIHLLLSVSHLPVCLLLFISRFKFPSLSSSLSLPLTGALLSRTRQEDSLSLWRLTCGNFPSLMTRNVPITSPDVSLPIRH